MAPLINSTELDSWKLMAAGSVLEVSRVLRHVLFLSLLASAEGRSEQIFHHSSSSQEHEPCPSHQQEAFVGLSFSPSVL